MGFLDNKLVKKTEADKVTEEAPKKINPFLKKPAIKEENKTVETTTAKKILFPLKKKEVATEVKADETTEEAPEVKVEETPEVKEESKEIPVAEAGETNTVEEKVEDKEATKQPAKKKASKTKAKSKEDVEEIDTDEDGFVNMPTTQMSFADAVLKITSPFVDEKWEELKEEIKNELSKIVINTDMNPGTLKITISELSIIRDKVWLPLQEMKSLYESIGAKEPEGLIERVKKVNLGSGNNDMMRKKAGIMACLSYEADSGNINLYEMLDEFRSRYFFLKSVEEHIRDKSNMLITMNGALKLEKDHAIRGE